MILIGQFDSPFVRRVAVALEHYGIPYDHHPWSTFRDADQIAQYNPLRRVPTLVLERGEVLVESGAILDHLDELAGADRALIARTGYERRAVLRLCALATGLCDKMVSLIYERVLHDMMSPAWITRCETQVTAVLDLLEAERSGSDTQYWMGVRLTHADVATTCAMRFLREAHAKTFDIARWPNLASLSDRCEEVPAFSAVTQVFIPPA